ncbi:MAG: VOC family protein [Candidatus Moranbacteria bacterium]|nr:VOC family protein [Candidatus Moranbacteria bacterium]
MKYNIQNCEKFLDDIFGKLVDIKIDVSGFYLDHIAYRVETLERYEEFKKEFLQKGELISENLIKNRPIAVFQLNSPMTYKNMNIRYLELPAPSDHKFFPEGFEHAEFVVDSSLEEFVRKYPNVEFKIDKKEINTEYVLDLGDGLAVKFHEIPLSKVIEIEKQLK